MKNRLITQCMCSNESAFPTNEDVDETYNKTQQ